MSDIPPVYAGFWRRAGGAAIDMLVLMVSSEALTWAGLDIRDPWVDLAVWTFVGWMYYACFHSSAYQATPGQRAFGMKITDLRGERLGFARASGRFVASWLSAALLLVGYIMAAWNPRRQTLHDRLARTVVVGAAVSAPDVAAGGGVMATDVRTRLAAAILLIGVAAWSLASMWSATDTPLVDGASAPVSTASPDKEESVSFAIYTLPFFSGDARLSREGVRRYRHSEVRETRYPDSEPPMTARSIGIAEGYSIEASIFPEQRLEGFGLSLKKDGGGFSWEWFDRETEDVFRKRQGSGRVKVRFASARGGEEVAEVLFLDDVTMRLKRYWFLPFRERDSDRMVVKRGSVVWLGD